MQRMTRGMLLASAATLLLTSTTFAATDTATQAKPIKCYGVNSCKGKGQCGNKGANACAGQNSCKGKGWLYLSAEQCSSKGGKVISGNQ